MPLFSVPVSPGCAVLDAIVSILVALVNVFPDLLDALKPNHPITKRVKDILPVKSKSREVADKLAGK